MQRFLQGMKFHVYFIIVSFFILWCQSVQITVTSSQDYAVKYQDDIVVSATSIVLESKNPKLERIGVLAWAVVGIGIAGVAFTGFLNSRYGRKKQSNIYGIYKRTAYESKKRTFGRSPVMYQKYGRNIEMRKYTG